MSSNIIAALDLGSNTFRLMLAVQESGAWTGKKVYQHIPRLSEKLTDGGKFAPAALTRAWEALEDFNGLIKKSGAGKALAGATMAARLAADGPEFMAEIAGRYGWETMILPGEEEARLTATGVLSGLQPIPADALIFDIGGRSTEFISAKNGRINKNRSLAIGVVALTEAYLAAPARPGQLEAVAHEVRRVLAQTDFSDLVSGSILAGTAGTVTTVAALLLKLTEYKPELVNNARLDRASIEALLKALAAETVEERVEKHGLHPRRADAIVAGLVLVMEIMDFFRQAKLIVSDNGLLEGIWLKAAGLI